MYIIGMFSLHETRKTRFRLARPPGRKSRPAGHHAASAPAAKAGKNTQSPPVPKATAFPLDSGSVRLVGVLLACASLPYLNILLNGFVYDDDTLLVQNPYVRGFQHLKEIFTGDIWSFRGLAVTNYYRPMMTLGYMLIYKIFGLRPTASISLAFCSTHSSFASSLRSPNV